VTQTLIMLSIEVFTAVKFLCLYAL